MLVVIGGSSGVGLGLLEHFVTGGKNVINGSRSKPELRNDFLEHSFLDVSDAESIKQFFDLPSKILLGWVLSVMLANAHSYRSFVPLLIFLLFIVLIPTGYLYKNQWST